jgi:hypothetical protein
MRKKPEYGFGRNAVANRLADTLAACNGDATGGLGQSPHDAFSVKRYPVALCIKKLVRQ